MPASAATPFAMLALVVALAGCSPPAAPIEDFDSAFARMRSDPAALAARTPPNVRIVETVHRGDGVADESRALPCSLHALQAAGWRLLPSEQRVAASGVRYGMPERSAPDRIAVTLGPADGGPDVRYVFQANDGRWTLARVELHTYLEPDAPLPPSPCPAAARAKTSTDANPTP